MAVPASLKTKYVLLIPEGMTEEDCYFCREPAIMDELTPSLKASEADLLLYKGEWSRVRSCRACWGKIYTANIASNAKAFGTKRGLMTLEQKAELIGIRKAVERLREVKATSNPEYRIGFEDLVVPKNLVKLGDSFQLGLHPVSAHELLVLQGPLAMVYMGMDKSRVRFAYDQVKASLDPSKMLIHYEMLGLNTETKSQEW